MERFRVNEPARRGSNSPRLGICFQGFSSGAPMALKNRQKRIERKPGWRGRTSLALQRRKEIQKQIRRTVAPASAKPEKKWWLKVLEMVAYVIVVILASLLGAVIGFAMGCVFGPGCRDFGHPSDPGPEPPTVGL
jgi:hypothetical protein